METVNTETVNTETVTPLVSEDKQKELSDAILAWKRLKLQEAEIKDKLQSLNTLLLNELPNVGGTFSSVVDDELGQIKVGIKVVAPSMIVDTDKLKKAGLFEEYSKVKKGYSSLVEIK
jgi:hypothetical protein